MLGGEPRLGPVAARVSGKLVGHTGPRPRMAARRLGAAASSSPAGPVWKVNQGQEAQGTRR